jgi:hypothetical protein
MTECQHGVVDGGLCALCLHDRLAALEEDLAASIGICRDTAKQRDKAEQRVRELEGLIRRAVDGENTGTFSAWIHGARAALAPPENP